MGCAGCVCARASRAKETKIKREMTTTTKMRLILFLSVRVCVFFSRLSFLSLYLFAIFAIFARKDEWYTERIANEATHHFGERKLKKGKAKKNDCIQRKSLKTRAQANFV